jgi:serine/threonine protein kinase
MRIVAPLGAGGMGEVIGRATRGSARRCHQGAAAGLRRRSMAPPFEEEARAAGQLNHPNVLTVYDVGAHDPSTGSGQAAPYIVSELLEGRTVRNVLEDGPLSVRAALDVARQMAEGLAAAHDKGIVHRDLKPENLFLTTGRRL